MKVKLLTTWAGKGGCFFPGQVIDVPAAAARRMIAAKEATAVGEAPPIEVAAAPEPELAARTKRPKKTEVGPPESVEE